MMTGKDLKRAVEAVGNGGIWGAAYRVSVWTFCSLVGVVGVFSWSTLERIENNQKEFIRAIAEMESRVSVHDSQILDLKNRTNARYTSDQAIADWRAQRRVDDAQDKDRQRVERRLELELQAR